MSAPTLTGQEAVQREPSEPAGQTLSNPFTGGTLKPIFKDLATRGYAPHPPERSRALIVGEYKTGKSTFACSNPHALVLDWEGGANAVCHPRAYRVDLSGADSQDPLPLYERVKSILLGDAKSPQPQFRTVVIDTVDAMIEQLAITFCQTNSIEHLSDYRDGRMGYAMVRQQLFRDLQEIANAGYGVHIVAHLDRRVISTRDASETVLEFAISDSFKRAALKWVEQVLHVSQETKIVYPEIETRIKDKVIRRQDTTRPEHVTTVVLRTRAIAGNAVGGCRVAIPDKLILPAEDGWQTYTKAYAEEVERVRSRETAATASSTP